MKPFDWNMQEQQKDMVERYLFGEPFGLCTITVEVKNASAFCYRDCYCRNCGAWILDPEFVDLERRV
jgi:hypothetical protein